MIKWTITVALIVIFSLLHIQGSETELIGHLFHQQLFFIPIILASFWFQLRAGLFVAILVSIIYLSTMFIHMTRPGIIITVISQVSLYIFVAALIGWLTTRLEKQQEETIAVEKERSMVKLASAISNEIYGIANALESKYLNAKKAEAHAEDQDLQEEIKKLKQLTNAFGQFDTLGEYSTLTKDLTEVIQKAVKKATSRAKKAGVALVTDLDQAGCPSMVINEAIERLVFALIDNAIDASPPDTIITIRSVRKGSYCHLEVEDQGHGISEENLPKLFAPLFTTKEEGHGLSLAAGKKIMKDCEGDILYEPAQNGGAIFKLILPRENASKNLEQSLSEGVTK